jgi:hypothetical protein
VVLPVKALVALTEMVAATLLAAAAAPDGLATRIALYAAAGAGAAWLWKNVLRPVAKVLHRMAKAVEALEDLPTWRRKTDRRIRHMELVMGHMNSGQSAILRELGLEDKVRQTFSDPQVVERLLADFGDDDDEESAGPS